MSSTVLFSTNFEGLAANAVPSYITNISPATFRAQIASAISGTVSLTDGNATNGDTCVFNNVSAADGGIRYVQTYPSNASTQSGVMPFLRSDVGNTQGYTFIWSSGSGWNLYKRVASANTFISASTTNFSYYPAPGDIFWVDAYISGTTIAIKMWKHGTAEPTSYTTFTDSSVTTVGVPALRAALSGGTLTVAVDDLTLYSGAGWAPASVVIPVADANIVWPPGPWQPLVPATYTTYGLASGTAKQATAEGAYFIANVTGTTSISISVDVTPLSGAGIAAGSYPQYKLSINNGSSIAALPGATTIAQLTSGQTSIAVGTGLDPQLVYEVKLWLKGVDQTAGDRWGNSTTSPSNVLRVTGINVDTGGSTVPYAYTNAATMIVFSDSIGAGKYVLATPGSTTEPGVQDGTQSLAACFAKGMGAEYGLVCYESQGFEQTGSGNVPGIQSGSAWQYYASGQSRLSSGLFSPMPTYIAIMHGYNGTTTSADVTNLLTNIRAATVPGVWIFLIIPVGAVISNSRTPLIAGYQAYRSANPGDARVALIDVQANYGSQLIASFNSYVAGTSTIDSVDSVHPNQIAISKIAPAMASLMQQAVANANLGAVTNRLLSYPAYIAT